MKGNFILTSDLETKDKLMKLGFVYMGQEGNKYRFMNDSTCNFASEVDSKKVLITDMLTI